MLAVVKQKGFLTSVVIYPKIVTPGGSTEHFTTNDGFRIQCQCKIQCVGSASTKQTTRK